MLRLVGDVVVIPVMLRLVVDVVAIPVMLRLVAAVASSFALDPRVFPSGTCCAAEPPRTPSLVPQPTASSTLLPVPGTQQIFHPFLPLVLIMRNSTGVALVAGMRLNTAWKPARKFAGNSFDVARVCFATAGFICTWASSVDWA